MNLLQQYESKQIAKLMEGREIPDFRPGDNIRISFEIIEGTSSRVQAFEGVCIRRKSRDIGSTFTVRKISGSEGVERTFPLYSPRVKKIEVIRKGKVRRAKLYYLRELRGKAARIKERVVARQPKKVT